MTCLRAAACALLVLLPACNEDALRPPPSSSARLPASGARSASAAAVAAPAPSNSPFSVVARSPDAFELSRLKGALFVEAAGFVALLDDGPLRQSPAIMKGLEKGQSGRILGGWPDVAWIVAGQETYHWSSDRWVEDPVLRPHEKLLDLVAWGENRAVAAVAMPGNDLRFVSFVTPGESGTPKPSPIPRAGTLRPPAAARAEPVAAPPTGEGEEASCKARMKPDGVFLAGLPGMELYAAGHACEPGGRGGAIVERWDPGQELGTVEALPEPESGHVPKLHGVLAWSPGEVIVYGAEGAPAAPYIARFDGKAWSLERVPFGGGVDTLAAAEDGTLWAAAGGAVWRKAGTTAWEKVPLPGDFAVQAVWPRTAADVWAAGREHEGKARAVLLRTGGGGARETIRLPPRNAMAGSIASSRRFFATSACDKVFVNLYLVGPSKASKLGPPASIPKDFAALKPVFEGELAGLQPVVVEEDETDLYVGVQAPSREIGRRLLAAYLEKNPGVERSATTGVFCEDPVIVKSTVKAP
jgi:hypothetical protein